jgi:hypothetical protein
MRLQGASVFGRPHFQWSIGAPNGGGAQLDVYVSRYPQTDTTPLNHCAGAPLIHLILQFMNARATINEFQVFVEMSVWTVASCGVIRLDHKAPPGANLWATCCMVLVIRYLTFQ